mmetsp:Transcript_18216/g.29116  ORF Transcript_18216/g.29116 Transcript_18216/m.29116 type:complete len:215 (+) Transcript_18216:135-779(+)|eukprot:CAMPEP_0198690264 /NCGR_PEP_ID=MMETSP1468-20131203/169070_1 /TAXON_ID=1461545 /ORGANISM="Mantoniella sp, Strain CCMP1436" /LENGTH=214 /DNA_ID=CAMNT_0044442293 /DNA_START=135 /DNA_END=779 /DNA_ORIENTATION=+
MKITVRTLRLGWSSIIDVPDRCLVGELRRVAAEAASIPASRAKLVLRGAALQDDLQIAPIKPGDTVLLASAPEAPQRTASGGAGAASNENIDDDDDDDLPRIDRTRLSPMQLRVVRFLQFRCHFPEAIIHGLICVRKRTWGGTLAWLIASRLSWMYDLGPVFLIVTGFAGIYFGLGTRKPGEASAYSIFNNFEELPGAYNAAQVENQLRHRNQE